MNFKTITAVILVALTGTVAAHDAQGVYVANLNLSELKIDGPDTTRFARGRDFELTDNEREDMRVMYLEQVRKAIAADDEYVLVDNADEADFVIRAELVKIQPLAPKDDFHSRKSSVKFVSQGAGRATIKFDITTKGNESVVIQSSRDAGYSWGKNDRFHNKHDVKSMFSAWGKDLMKELAGFKA